MRGGDSETGRPDSVQEVANFHFNFLGKIGV